MGKAHPRTPEGPPYPALAAADGQAREGRPLHQPFPYTLTCFCILWSF